MGSSGHASRPGDHRPFPIRGKDEAGADGFGELGPGNP